MLKNADARMMQFAITFQENVNVCLAIQDPYVTYFVLRGDMEISVNQSVVARMGVVAIQQPGNVHAHLDGRVMFAGTDAHQGLLVLTAAGNVTAIMVQNVITSMALVLVLQDMLEKIV